MQVGFRAGRARPAPGLGAHPRPRDPGRGARAERRPLERFRFSDRLWARVVYDFLLAHRARVVYRSHAAQSLAPLYLGRGRLRGPRDAARGRPPPWSRRGAPRAACSRRRSPTSWTAGDERARSAPPHRHRARPPRGGRRALPVKREVGDRARRSPPTSSRKATSCWPRVIRYRAARRVRLARGAARARSTTTAGPARSRSTPTRATATRSRPGPTPSARGWRRCAGGLAGGQADLASEIAGGRRELVRRARERAAGADAAALGRALDRLAAAPSRDARARRPARRRASRQVMARAQPRPDLTRHDRELEVVVDRPGAAFAAWYELFPRSAGPGARPPRDLRRRASSGCPTSPRMGFDVVYLPPDPPDRPHRAQGPEQRARRGPRRPGQPLGHRRPRGRPHRGPSGARHARRLPPPREAAQGLGLEIALDFAIQCSPDHPWVREHPEWFYRRPGRHDQVRGEPAQEVPGHLPDQLRDARPGPRSGTRCWAWCCSGSTQGVRTFRVDNPHTKPLDFWEWLIGQVQERDPDVVFLAEAFTRPKVMRALARWASPSPTPTSPGATSRRS